MKLCKHMNIDFLEGIEKFSMLICIEAKQKGFRSCLGYGFVKS